MPCTHARAARTGAAPAGHRPHPCPQQRPPGTGIPFGSSERGHTSGILLPQTADQGGTEPFPESTAYSPLDHWRIGQNIRSFPVFSSNSLGTSEKGSFSVSRSARTSSSLYEGRGAPSSFARSRDAASSLTVFQCPISVFLLPPGADLQLHESCHNNFLLK